MSDDGFDELRAEIVAKREDLLRRRRVANDKLYQKRKEKRANGEIPTMSYITGKLYAGVRPKPDTCEVCGRGGRIVYDHVHDTKEFRGWICHNCNVALGHVSDDPEILLKLAAYLDKHK